jgi:hypothetical protein
LFGVGGR